MDTCREREQGVTNPAARLSEQAQPPEAPRADGGVREDILAEVQRLINALEAHPDATVGERVRELLADIDAVHRAALTHLVAAIQGMAGEAFLNRLAADPAIRLLLMSYDLLAVDRRLLAEEAIDLVRGHLHAHGVDVELQEVIGGVVYVRLHGAGRDSVPADAVEHDLEEALREGLLGFQELVVRDGDTQVERTGFVPLGALRRVNRPVYRDVLPTADLAPGGMRAVDVEGESVLVANVDGTFIAVRNRCGPSPLPLQYSELRGAELTCSWHGCRYDLRSGHRLDREDAAPDERLAVLPVAVQDGVVRVAVSVEPAPPP